MQNMYKTGVLKGAKILYGLVLALVMITIASASAFALVNAAITATPVITEKGKTVVVEVAILPSGAPEHVTGLDLYLSYDPNVFGVPTVTDYNQGTWDFSQIDKNYDSNGVGLDTVKYTKAAIDPAKGIDLSGSVKMYKLEFPVKAGALLGNTSLIMADNFFNVLDQGFNPITGTYTSGVVGIVNPITSLTPNSANRGVSNLLVTINGQNTNFSNTSTVQFTDGTGITVAGVQYLSPTEIKATINIAADATLGSGWDVLVRENGTVIAKGTDMFTVNEATLDVPTNLSVAGIGSQWATPSWWAVAGATSYVVSYGTDINASNLGTITTTETWQTINGLNVETTYYVKVKAKNALTESAYSAPVQFATLPVQTPTNLSVNGIDQTKATPSWYSSNGATGYTISYGTDAGATNGGTQTTTETWATLSGLTPNTAYYVKVRADNAGKTSSAYSAPVSFNTAVVPPPTAPTGLTVNGIMQKQATPSWNSVSGATSYIISYGTDSGASNLGTITTTETWKTINGLNLETAYYVKVKAQNSYGESAYTNAVSFTTLPVAAPINLTVNGIGQDNATPSWNSSDGATGYTISYGTNAAADNLGTKTTVETWATLNGLNPDTTYYVKVRADNAGKTSSAYTAAVSFKTAVIPPQPPATPTNLSVNGIGPKWATPSWWSVADATSYIVSYGTDANASNLGTVNTTETFVSVNGLNVETNYYVKVKARNAVGDSAYTASVQFATLPVQTPTNLTVNGIGETYATPSWYSSDGATGYTISYGTDVNASNAGTRTTTETWANINGLTADTTYYVKVRADNAGKTSSAYSAPVSFKTTAIPVQPPATPTGLSITSISQTQATAIWDTVTGATYVVSYGTDSGATNLGEKAASNPTVNLTSLNPGTTYYVKVKSTNSNGESAWSTIVSFTTPAIGAPVITNISPNRGPVNTQITISGSGFGGPADGRILIFNGVEQKFISPSSPNIVSWTDTAIVVKIPEWVKGVYKVSISEKNNSASASNDDKTFTIMAATAIAKTYPNPFNPLRETENIEFVMIAGANVQVYLYDMTGQPIWKSGTQYYSAGTQTIVWDGMTFFSNLAGDGIVMVRVINEDDKTLIAKGKILVIKR